MDLINELKKLKKLRPDENYARISRRAILGDVEVIVKPLTTPWRILTHSLQFAGAITLTGLLLLLTLGSNLFSPFNIESLDPQSLQAEAEAIDIQIQLSGLAYSEPAPSDQNAPAAASLAPRAESSASNQEAAREATSLSPAAEKQAVELGLTPQSTSSAHGTTDDALQALTE